MFVHDRQHAVIFIVTDARRGWEWGLGRGKVIIAANLDKQVIIGKSNRCIFIDNGRVEHAGSGGIE